MEAVIPPHRGTFGSRNARNHPRAARALHSGQLARRSVPQDQTTSSPRRITANTKHPKPATSPWRTRAEDASSRHDRGRQPHRGEIRGAGRSKSPRSRPARSPWRTTGHGTLQVATITTRQITVANYGARHAPSRHDHGRARHRGELPGTARSKSPRSRPGQSPWRTTGHGTLQVATITAGQGTVANYRARHAPSRHDHDQADHRGELRGTGCSKSPRSRPGKAPWRTTGHGTLQVATITTRQVTVANYRAQHAPSRHDHDRQPHRGETPGTARSKSPRSRPTASPWRNTGHSTLQVATITAGQGTVANYRARHAPSRHDHDRQPHRGEIRGAGRSKSPRSRPGKAPWRNTGRRTLQVATITADSLTVAKYGAQGAPSRHDRGRRPHRGELGAQDRVHDAPTCLGRGRQVDGRIAGWRWEVLCGGNRGWGADVVGAFGGAGERVWPEPGRMAGRWSLQEALCWYLSGSSCSWC